MKKLKVMILGGVTLAAVMMMTSPVAAYDAGGQDPIVGNEQNVNGTNVNDVDPVEGELEVKGWIGTYDPTNPPNPDVPTPPDGSNSWVHVTIPKTLLFGSLVTDKGSVYSPKYKVTNLSEKDVKVTASRMEEAAPIVGISDKLDLNIVTGGNSYPVVANNGGLLGTQLPAADLGIIAGNNALLEFTLDGQFHGTYPAIGTPAMPTYKLVLTFETQ